MHNARRSIKALTVFLLYINTAIHKLRIWSIPIVCHIKAGCLSFGRHGTWTSLTENKPHPPGSSLVSLSFIWSHLFFLQANTSWWWASSWPSPRSRWSAPWRWRTSRSSPGSTEGCGSWRWRTCSWCWPESRTRSGDSGHMVEVWGGGEAFKWTEGWRLLDVEVMQQGQRGAVSVSLVKLFLSARLQGCSYEYEIKMTSTFSSRRNTIQMFIYCNRTDVFFLLFFRQKY